MIVELAKDIATTGAQTAKMVPCTSIEGVVQAQATSTSTIVVQGRFGNSSEWTDIVTLTNTDAKIVSLFPLMRVNITANAGTVDVTLHDGRP